MMRDFRSRHLLRAQAPFTLVEILIAITILGLMLGATLAIAAQAKLDVIKARQRWSEQHALEQAVEYFLLSNPSELSIPDGFLPEGYQASCVINVVTAELPDYASSPYKGWVLGEYVIAVFDESGEQVREQVIFKVIPESL